MKKMVSWLAVMVLLMSMLCVPVGFAEIGAEEEAVKYKCGDYTYGTADLIEIFLPFQSQIWYNKNAEKQVKSRG